MKIKTLKIDGYKNLINTELKHNSDLITIIGNNGSGKSNLLEALSIIFKNLYNNEKNIPFDFLLEYTTHSDKTIRVEKKKSKLSFHVDNEVRVSITEFLPKKVIAIYSGDEDRLWRECYYSFYSNYISNINKQRHASLPQMLYLNKFYWNIALLCLCLSSDENENFVKTVLGINKIDKIEFKYSKSNYSNYTNNPVLNFVETLDDKSEYTLKELDNILTLAYSINDIFSYLYIAFTPEKTKIIEKVSVMFNDGLMIEDLSEGQKKLLLIKAALEFAGQEDTLYLLDEPDAHVHVNNKDKIIKTFEPYKSNRQIVITTHSPTITQCSDIDGLHMMDSGNFIPKTQQEIIGEITGEFWNAHQQNSFLASNKDIILVEGKTDVAHIELALNKLKTKYDKYKNLEFTYLPFGGASGLKLFVDEFPIKKEKSVFAFVDKDQAGHDAIRETLDIENTTQFNGQIKNKIYINFIPLKDGYSKSIFIIEDYYPFDIYKDFYLKDVSCANEFKNPTNSNIKKGFAEFCKSLPVDDFEGFTKLFDLILSVKGINYTNNNIPSNPLASISEEETEIKEEDKPEYTEELHLEGKSQAIIDLYSEYKSAILALNKDINVEAKQNYMAFKFFSKNIVDICIQKKQLKFWLNLHYGELIDKEKVARNVSKIGHWGNGDYEVIISDNKNIDYILSLIKTVFEVKQTEYILS